MQKTLTFTIALLLTLTPNIAKASDYQLPLPVTPGSTNPAVTQANIKTTICKSGWTDTIRPPVSYTNKLKKTELAGTYKTFAATYGSALSNYELDHLISLQLGGNPTDIANLWVEPYAGQNARRKDVVETALKRLVCNNQLTLEAAQKAISTNWVTAYTKYVTTQDVLNATNNG